MRKACLGTCEAEETEERRGTLVVAIECRAAVGAGGLAKWTSLKLFIPKLFILCSQSNGEKLSGSCSRAGVGSKACVGDRGGIE